MRTLSMVMCNLDLKSLKSESCDRSSTITDEDEHIPNDHGDQLILDARNLNIKKVLLKSSNATLPFQVDTKGESLTIDLGPSVNDSSTSVLIYYSTSSTECTALQWLTKEQTADRQHPYMFSQCQAIHARSLYPCQDTPGVKSTYSARITCPKPLTVVMTKRSWCSSLARLVRLAHECSADQMGRGHEHISLRAESGDSIVSDGHRGGTLGFSRSKFSYSRLDGTEYDSTMQI